MSKNPTRYRIDPEDVIVLGGSNIVQDARTGLLGTLSDENVEIGYDDDDDEDWDDDDDIEDDDDDDDVVGAREDRLARRSERRSNRSERRESRVERRLDRRQDRRQSRKARHTNDEMMADLLADELENATTDTVTDTITLRPQADFTATDMTFEGSDTGVKVSSVTFGRKTVFNPKTPVSITLFGLDSKLRRLLSGHKLRGGLDISVVLTIPATSTAAVQVHGLVPRESNC